MTEWELAKRIFIASDKGGMTLDEIKECFGTDDFDVIFENGYDEALIKYNKWLNVSAIREVGDLLLNNEKVYCVTAVTDKTIHLIDRSGKVYHISKDVAGFKKITKISIQELLNTMGFAEDNQNILIEVDII